MANPNPNGADCDMLAQRHMADVKLFARIVVLNSHDGSALARNMRLHPGRFRVEPRFVGRLELKVGDLIESHKGYCQRADTRVAMRP